MNGQMPRKTGGAVPVKQGGKGLSEERGKERMPAEHPVLVLCLAGVT